MGSTTILTFRERTLRGVNTMRPPSTFASSGSPVRRPSLRRIGPGRTTWPFVETLVSMVRQSYPNLSPVATSATSDPPPNARLWLIVLLQKQGVVVTRDELKQALWPADTFVNYDANVNTTVNKLRQ